MIITFARLSITKKKKTENFKVTVSEIMIRTSVLNQEKKTMNTHDATDVKECDTS